LLRFQALKVDGDEWQKGNASMELHLRGALELCEVLPHATNMTLLFTLSTSQAHSFFAATKKHFVFGQEVLQTKGTNGAHF
jgi:hypothetical protein